MSQLDKSNRRRRALLLRGVICSSIALAAFDCASQDPSKPAGTCEDPQPVLLPDQTPSGYAQCADGSIDRVGSVACSTEVQEPTCSGDEDSIGCTSDADCTERPHGVCRHQELGCIVGEFSSCDCIYPCETDADCTETQACVCGGVFDGRSRSTCVTASCRTGYDCASGECGVAVNTATDGGTYIDVSCRTPTDSCRTASQCTEPDPLCRGQEWSCSNLNFGGCGRALTVESHARVAPAATRRDWQAEIRVDVSQLSAAERELLAAEWTETAMYEHASVASFSRFALQLMQLGAPPEMLHDVHRAALDEIEHARVAFAVASAYAGRPVGPGPLDLTGLTLTANRREVIRNLVMEACVSETLGVLELRDKADAVTDPVIRELLRAIADDEERHAALAWRCLAWLLRSADDDTRRDVAHAFDEARDTANTEALRDAYELVVIPCAAAVGLSEAA